MLVLEISLRAALQVLSNHSGFSPRHKHPMRWDKRERIIIRVFPCPELKLPHELKQKRIVLEAHQQA